MEHMHLVVNLANESVNNQPSVISNTGVSLKINKALLISKRDKLFFNEEFYKYAIELTVNGVYWVVFRRYSEVREEHERMCKKHPTLKKESFPPRNPFNKTVSPLIFNLWLVLCLIIIIKGYISNGKTTKTGTIFKKLYSNSVRK